MIDFSEEMEKEFSNSAIGVSLKLISKEIQEIFYLQKAIREGKEMVEELDENDPDEKEQIPRTLHAIECKEKEVLKRIHSIQCLVGDIENLAGMDSNDYWARLERMDSEGLKRATGDGEYLPNHV